MNCVLSSVIDYMFTVSPAQCSAKHLFCFFFSHTEVAECLLGCSPFCSVKMCVTISP